MDNQAQQPQVPQQPQQPQQGQQGGIGQKQAPKPDHGFTFTLQDADGNPHTYRVDKKHEPIPRSDGPSGLRLLNRVVKVAGEPIAELLETNAGQLMEMYVEASRANEDVGQEDIMDAIDSENINDKLDLQLSKALEKLTTAFDQLDPVALFGDLFYWTTRDGKSLQDPDEFNQAFQGNYMEAMKAAYQVCVYNGFFGSLGGRIDKDGETNE